MTTKEIPANDSPVPGSQSEQAEVEKATTYQTTVELSSDARQKLDEEIEKRRQLKEVLTNLQAEVEEAGKKLTEAVNKAKPKALELVNPMFAEDVASYIEGLDRSKELTDGLDELNDYGLFDGERYDFGEEMLYIPATLASESLPRLAKITEVGLKMYDPATQEAILNGMLYFDDDPGEDPEHYVRIKLQLDRDQTGQFSATAEL